MTNYMIDKDGKQIDTSTTLSKPSDRHFRNAWTISGNVISEDLTKAKEIFKTKIRQIRKSLLEAEDIVYMKALESSDADAQTASINKKKALRDAPANSKITDADTIDKLKDAWDTTVLGNNPYK